MPVFLPGESNGQRSLVGYSPLSCRELGMTKPLNNTAGAPASNQRLELLLKGEKAMAAIGSEYGKFSFVPEECQLKDVQKLVRYMKQDKQEKYSGVHRVRRWDKWV